MSSHYTTEPPPTASVLVHTTAGPLTISLFANQTPLTCRNFLQHVLDGDYTNNIFHRVSPGFVLQTGDPTGTGEGGQNIYEDREFERYDEDWARLMGREKDEKIVFGDEVHSRLKFNRRGLVGMAKGTGAGGAGYGSQFFITLGDCRAQLDGTCTMFGRVEGEGIYNVVKISEGELREGTERPMYPEKILSVEIIDLPKGDAWQGMRKRIKVAERTVEAPAKKKPLKKKGGKTLLSFGGDEGDDDAGEVAVRPKKAKFNPTLIDAPEPTEPKPKANGTTSSKEPKIQRRRDRSASPTVPQKRKASSQASAGSLSPDQRRKPSFHDPTTQLPLRDPEVPSHSPTPEEEPQKSKTSTLEAEIVALKASMRRNVPTNTNDSKHKKSALESLIPATSMRGRKRPRPGEMNSKDDANALKMLNAFRARLDAAKPDRRKSPEPEPQDVEMAPTVAATSDPAAGDDDEAALCDLHFIANCQSCSRWDDSDVQGKTAADDSDNDGREWMSHSLSFAKDRLGKDLSWRKKNEDDLVVIDPREKEKELKQEKRRERDRDKGKGKGKERERGGRW